MKNIILGVLIGIVGLFVLALIFVPEETIDTTPQSDWGKRQEAKTVPSFTEENYELLYEYFAEGCEISPSWRNYCRCTYDYLMDKYSLQEIIEAEDDIVEEAAEVCMVELT